MMTLNVGSAKSFLLATRHILVPFLDRVPPGRNELRRSQAAFSEAAETMRSDDALTATVRDPS
jgi:hypothetical protein